MDLELPLDIADAGTVRDDSSITYRRAARAPKAKSDACQREWGRHARGAGGYTGGCAELISRAGRHACGARERR